MLHKTRGIVLSHLKYGDTSVVTTIYTETHGRKSFLVNGVYGKKGKFHPTFFQPLTLLNLEAYIKPKNSLQRIKEIGFAEPKHSMHFDTSKSAIALFLSEILYKSLKEEEPNPTMFEYLYNSIQILDIKDKDIANFHLVFLLSLTKHLGFHPNDNYSQLYSIFDTTNGKFRDSRLSRETAIEIETSKILHALLNVTFENMETVQISHTQRIAVLELLIEFYSLHLGGMSHIKSLPVLQSVFE